VCTRPVPPAKPSAQSGPRPSLTSGFHRHDRVTQEGRHLDVQLARHDGDRLHLPASLSPVTRRLAASAKVTLTFGFLAGRRRGGRGGPV
jgi:hypothetical protein